MIQRLCAICLLLILFSCSTETSENKTKGDAEIEKKVKNLLSNMTVEEKVGQMTQVTIDVILYDTSTTQIDPKKLEKAIVEKKVGSILNVKVEPYDIKTWHNILTAIQDKAMETPNKIPVIYGIDAIHGANYIKEGTLFPHNIGMAATRNTELARKTAEITALETRASGIRWNFDPVVGMGRQPLWSRFEETYGEDVHLTSEMGVASIKGYESKDFSDLGSVASCMKHYLGYSLPVTGKDRTPAYIPDRQLREIFLPPFQRAVEAGTSTVMVNSGEINGVPVHASEYYLTTILREELGFEGLAVSDWEDVIRLHTRHKVADTPKEAVKLAVNAGIDMSMVPYDYSFYDYLVELVKEGEVKESRIDEAVSRILKLKFQLGLFENPYPETEALANFGKPEYKEIAKQSALESITLLKNENNILPLAKDAKILVTGPGAHSLPALHGSWSFTWQGKDINAYPEGYKTLLEAIQDKIGEENVVTETEEDYGAANNYSLKDIHEVDAVVICVGEDAYAESPGGIDDLSLSSTQIQLVQTAALSDTPVIVVLLEGRPRIIRDFADQVEGILMAYRPASQGGEAIADILFGDYNPSGKLPFTYPRYSGDMVLYDYKGSENMREDIPNEAYRPQFSFGYGLSYSNYSYTNLTLSSKAIKDNQELTVTISVTNDGKMDGKHTVELYLKDLFASVTPSNKRLKGFEKIEVPAGSSKEVSFQINKKDLAFVGLNNKWVTENGEFQVIIGNLSETFIYEN